MTHMRAIFIRHGESTGNAGVPCHDLATIELTERGYEQARAVAASWTQAPRSSSRRPIRAPDRRPRRRSRAFPACRSKSYRKCHRYGAKFISPLQFICLWKARDPEWLILPEALFFLTPAPKRAGGVLYWILVLTALASAPMLARCCHNHSVTGFSALFFVDGLPPAVFLPCLGLRPRPILTARSLRC